MDYEWDPMKAEINAIKHEIRFVNAVGAFSDPRAITIQDSSPDEERFVTIGMDAFVRLLVVVYTWRGERIRIISAGKATRAGRNQYAAGEP
jgi:uncharacterized protein